MPKRLYLVRHGETKANSLRIINGQGAGPPRYGSHLSNKGMWQADLLGNALEKVKIHQVYSSPAIRAVKTANNIIWYIDRYSNRYSDSKDIKLKKSVIKELLETNYGVIEGLKGKEAREKHPDLFMTYHEKPSQTVFPEGESIAEVYKRVGDAIDTIIAKHSFDENILVVSHGGIMALIFIHIFKFDLDTMFHAIRHHNCGLSIIEWRKPDNPWIVFMNDMSFLGAEYSQMLNNPHSLFLSD